MLYLLNTIEAQQRSIWTKLSRSCTPFLACNFFARDFRDPVPHILPHIHVYIGYSVWIPLIKGIIASPRVRMWQHRQLDQGKYFVNYLTIWSTYKAVASCVSIKIYSNWGWIQWSCCYACDYHSWLKTIDESKGIIILFIHFTGDDEKSVIAKDEEKAKMKVREGHTWKS